MQPTTDKFPVVLTMAGALSAQALGQIPPPPLTDVEPGLERAVRWVWKVEPSPERDWGLELPAFAPPAADPQSPAPGPSPRLPTGRPTTYIVQRGDALAKISRRFGITVDQLKRANGLTSDIIRVGDELRIPSPEEIAAMTPATPTPRPARPQAPVRPEEGSPEAQALDTLTLQVFLDRSLFSAGPIDGEPSPRFQQLVQLYLDSHADTPDADTLLAKARAAVRQPTTTYKLRLEDFRFIAPPKAAIQSAARATPTPKKRSGAAPTPAPTPKPTYEDLTTTQMLAYRSPWEFVAERYHCSEAYLRKLNPTITGFPGPGTEFRVPAVVPFEIEKAFAGPIQPRGGEGPNPMSAAIVDRTRLEIRRGDQLLAVMPVSIARPGLRGRDTWVVQNAIPRPRLTSRKESRSPAPTPTRIYGRENPNAPKPTPTPVPPLQVLAAGPNNPVGLVWIDLARPGDEEPLPYGLHGTSIPEEMASHESLGGIRMANWDILRAVRLLPPSTPIEWKQSPPPRAVAPAM